MNKKILLCIVILVISVIVFSPPLHAHELLPEDIQKYLDKNPNLDIEEIQRLMDHEKSPLISLTESIRFVGLGIKHILTGYDHILFLISLLLVFISVREILKLTATFTLAHTTTFILAGTSLFTLTSKIVEPMIAFSITYVALTTVFLKHISFFNQMKNKIATVFFFGLIHGLGFAGLLGEVKIPESNFLPSLISFNIGIEVGQLLILALVTPLLLLLKKTIHYDRVIKITAITIATLGLVWGIQRIFS